MDKLLVFILLGLVLATLVPVASAHDSEEYRNDHDWPERKRDKDEDDWEDKKLLPQEGSDEDTDEDDDEDDDEDTNTDWQMHRKGHGRSSGRHRRPHDRHHNGNRRPDSSGHSGEDDPENELHVNPTDGTKTKKCYIIGGVCGGVALITVILLVVFRKKIADRCCRKTAQPIQPAPATGKHSVSVILSIGEDKQGLPWEPTPLEKKMALGDMPFVLPVPGSPPQYFHTTEPDYTTSPPAYRSVGSVRPPAYKSTVSLRSAELTPTE